MLGVQGCRVFLGSRHSGISVLEHRVDTRYLTRRGEGRRQRKTVSGLSREQPEHHKIMHRNLGTTIAERSCCLVVSAHATIQHDILNWHQKKNSQTPSPNHRSHHTKTVENPNTPTARSHTLSSARETKERARKDAFDAIISVGAIGSTTSCSCPQLLTLRGQL